MAAPTRKSVELFYDVVSPYSWFAFEVLCRYKNVWDIDLKLKPFFLGGIMNEASNRPPAMVPNKGKYLFKEIQLLAKYYNVPLVPPKDPAEAMFVKGSLPTQRFITAVDLLDSSKDEDIVAPESLAQAGQKAGLSEDQVKACLQKMKDSDVKDRLKQYTSEALEYDAFGSPTIIAHGKKPVMLFGSDRFPILAQILDEKWEGPVPGSKL